VKLADWRRRLANFTYPARTLTVLFPSVTAIAENRKESSKVAAERIRLARSLTKSNMEGEQSRSNGFEQQIIAIAIKENTVPDNYTEQLAERLRAQQSPGRSLNKAAFLTVKADVAAALEAGFLSKDIWSDLRTCKRIDFSYDTFLRLVKLYISSPPVVPTPVAFPSRGATVKDKPAGLPATASSQPVESSSEKASFVHNAVPNKDELL
jgi:hypothetical protein